MKTKHFKTLLVTNDKNVVLRLNDVLNQAHSSDDFGLQITHFEGFSEANATGRQVYDLWIATEDVLKNSTLVSANFPVIPTTDLIDPINLARSFS